MSKRSYTAFAEGECTATVVDAAAVTDARSGMADEATTTKATDIFSALADPTRLRMLMALSRCELCVCDLASVCGISQSGVSHQLRLLRDRGLVAFRRDGQRAVYRLADDHVRTLIAEGLEHASEERVS
ncbi:MAG: winged helix-turn-helix transcriptional regulator [Coriobacteriales bacterium]|nr:winged helix-turn-helix transcriptional regulator [Coriobacteriales bacterium]